MKTIKLKALLSIILSSVFIYETSGQVKVTTQPDVLLTQHWAMPTLLDPAATGDIDYIRLRGGARIDWLGSHDSPKNYLITADSPFKLFGKRIGAGIVFNSNSYDLYRNMLISAQGSYKLKIKNTTLSIGVQIGYYNTKFKGSEYVMYNNTGNNTEGGIGEGDNTGQDGDDGTVTPGEGSVNEGTEGEEPYQTDYPTQDVEAGIFDIGVGVRFQHPKFYVGISAQHLTNPTMRLSKDGESTSDTRYMEAKLPLTLYFDAGGNIGINNTLFTLQPSVLLGSDFSKIDAVVEMRATYNNKITFGLDYRWNRAAGVVAGLSLKNFYVGYSWEYDYSSKPKGSTGNHEIILGYQFKMDMGGKNTFSHRSIRIM